MVLSFYIYIEKKLTHQQVKRIMLTYQQQGGMWNEGKI